MPARRLFRVLLSIALVALLWWRMLRHGGLHAGAGLLGVAALTAILLLFVLAEVLGSRRARHRPVDEVPKKPLGLDS